MTVNIAKQIEEKKRYMVSHVFKFLESSSDILHDHSWSHYSSTTESAEASKTKVQMFTHKDMWIYCQLYQVIKATNACPST